MFDVAELETRLRSINYKDFESLVKFYKWSVSCGRGGWYLPLDFFKNNFKDAYKVISAVLHKRAVVRKNIEFMTYVNADKVYFGNLTFKTEFDNLSVESKRKQVWRHLNKYFGMLLVVEEYGTQNTCRYHVHFCGVLKKGCTASMVRENWHSFSKCKLVKSERGVSRYLCDYISKQVPRIRRNKELVRGLNEYDDMIREDRKFNGPMQNEKWKKYTEELDEMYDWLPF